MSAIAVAQGAVVRRGEGKSYWAQEMLVEVKTPLLWEFLMPPDCAIPPHVHRDDDELHYLLEGTATYTVGDRTMEAVPGSAIFLPKEVPHSLVFGPEGGRWLWLTRPELLGIPEAIAVPVTEPDAKRKALEIPEELIVETFAKYGMEFLPPEEG